VDKEEADDNTSIIKDADGLWLPAQHLRQWLKEVCGLVYTNAKYSVLMKEIGLEPKVIRTGAGIRFQVWGVYNVE
jgi:outer membrane biogenesis lipoprotein LolB